MIYYNVVFQLCTHPYSCFRSGCGRTAAGTSFINLPSLPLDMHKFSDPKKTVFVHEQNIHKKSTQTPKI